MLLCEIFRIFRDNIFEIFALTMPTCLLVSTFVPNIFRNFCPRFSKFLTFSQKFFRNFALFGIKFSKIFENFDFFAKIYFSNNIFDFLGYYFMNIFQRIRFFEKYF